MCPGSSILSYVSDYNVIVRKANCPICQRYVKITIPDRKMHGNRARYSKHAELWVAKNP